MDFQKGDNISITQTSTEGVFIGVENEEMFVISIHQHTVPVLKRNIKKIAFDWTDDDRLKKRKLKTITTEQKPHVTYAAGSQWDAGTYIVLFPETTTGADTPTSFRVYIIHQDPNELKCTYKLSKDHTHIFTHTLTVGAFQCGFIHQLAIEQLHEAPEFQLTFEWQDPLIGHQKVKSAFKLRPKRLFSLLHQLTHGDITYITIPIDTSAQHADDNYVAHDIPLKAENKIQQLLAAKKRIDEVDLHIEKLCTDHHHLTNAQIIQIQLDYFDKIIHHAIMLNQDALTVIHGVGKGRLKEEIHNLLSMYKEVRHFISDWSPRYGYGATQIFFYT